MGRELLQKTENKPTPRIYGFEFVDPDDAHKGFIKVGYTTKTARERVNQIMHTSSVKWRIVFDESSVRDDGTYFKDGPVHKYLVNKGKERFNAGDDRNEWFRCSVDDIREAVNNLKLDIVTDEERTETFELRPEQREAVERTIKYYGDVKYAEPNSVPKFLWNAKMRFGKTFAAYELAKRMGLKRILVLTFKPAVESAWRSDLKTHVDFEGWQFVSNNDAKDAGTTIEKLYLKAIKNRPIVVFGSFQDLLGTNENGGIKAKNEFIHAEHWDLVIFDEYHFGAWRENAKKLFETPDEEEDSDFDIEQYKAKEADNAYNESFLPISTDYYLFLSGTPFRAINSGEFIEEQIYNWTYSDEQSAKENWVGPDNPYEALPRMIMLTYRLPEEINNIALQGEFDEFDLNVFFKAEGQGENAKFVYENEVQKWLDLIRGAYLPAVGDDLKLGKDNRPPMPYSDVRLLSNLNHTVWFLPSVASCQAMNNLLMQKHNVFYHDYKIIPCAGIDAGIGEKALEPVLNSMKDPIESKTITLTCGKLTTGVTVRPWTGIFMLRNLKSPETYFQAAFRVQSPWEITNEYNEKEIIKKDCYVFDFALDRALRQISDYSCSLNVDDSNPEKKVADFIKFLPVLAYDGSAMTEVDAEEILDFAVAGTSATLLARRWESALLVNVDNDTLRRLMNSKEAMDALMRIEGFRSLRDDIEKVINKSEHVKKVKTKEGELTPTEKKQISEEEKDFKSKRKEIQEKLIKFATRIPIFMYLTDYRERTLKDVVTQLEPELFKKVSGLDVKDFELLCSLGVFNSQLMNDAIFKFKRYEDASLSYTGVEKQTADEIGGWDTTLRREEYVALYYNQQQTMDIASAIDMGALQTADDETMPDDEPMANESDSGDVSLPGSDAGENENLPVNGRQEPKKEEHLVPQVDVGDEVFHKKFGKGEVVGLKDNHVTVRFADGDKMFGYPQAFDDGFLFLVS